MATTNLPTPQASPRTRWPPIHGNTYLPIVLTVWGIVSGVTLLGLGPGVAAVESTTFGLILAISGAVAWAAPRRIGFDTKRAATQLYALP